MPLPRLVAVAGHLVSRRWHRVVEQHGVPSTGLTLLLILAGSDGLTHREAARLCWVSPGTLTSVVDRLEEQGLVERHREGGDRRVVRLRLTPTGHDMAGRAGSVMSAEFGAWHAGLPDDDAATIRRYLITTITALRDYDAATRRGDR